MEVSAVMPQYLFTCYNHIKALLEIAVGTSGGRFKLKDLVQDIYSGEQQLWLCFEPDPLKYLSVCTTRVQEYPQCKLLGIVYAAGGDMEVWRDPLLDVLERFAMDNGCDGLEMIGRLGWGRVLKGRGWTPENTIYRMNLEGRHE